MAGDRGRLDAVRISGTVSDQEIARLARMQFIASLAGLAAGLILALGGSVLVVLGIQGSLNWSMSAFGVSNKLVNASPGVVLIVAGVLTIALSRFSVTINRSATRPRRSKST
jgi:hypothetical protein